MKEMRVYTRTGDKGTTSLASGTRVPKDHPRLETYGSVDELNSNLGMLTSLVVDDHALKILAKVQNRIFTISSRLAVDKQEYLKLLPEIKDKDITELETDMDRMLDLLPPLRNFIIPGGNQAVAQCHIARTVCRRVERLMVGLSETVNIQENMLKYINRLSDYLFVLARKTGQDLGVEEITWTADYENRGM